MNSPAPSSPHQAAPSRRVLLLGATGTIGRATAQVLVARGYDVICVVRPGSAVTIPGAATRPAPIDDGTAFSRQAIRGEGFDAIVSCMASRTGSPADAWAIDHAAHSAILSGARSAGIPRMVLLSAICVQKPQLAFQHAKLKFEAELIESGLSFSIVRPTAYFKSLSGQVERVRQGKPYLVFGDGRLTACKPISDRDLACYLADCLDDPARQNRILPIGGPGPAITPLEQGEELFRLFGRKPRFKRVPVAMLDAIAAALGALGRLAPPLAAKAELARIGRYYASESMLVLDPATGRYDAAATPETGSDRLFEYYARLVDGSERPERGDHAVY